MFGAYRSEVGLRLEGDLGGTRRDRDSGSVEAAGMAVGDDCGHREGARPPAGPSDLDVHRGIVGCHGALDTPRYDRVGNQEQGAHGRQPRSDIEERRVVGDVPRRRHIDLDRAGRYIADREAAGSIREAGGTTRGQTATGAYDIGGDEGTGDWSMRVGLREHPSADGDRARGAEGVA